MHETTKQQRDTKAKVLEMCWFFVYISETKSSPQCAKASHVCRGKVLIFNALNNMTCCGLIQKALTVKKNKKQTVAMVLV